MSQDNLKREAARAAFRHIQPHLREDMVIGVGTGSTTNYFIEELGKDTTRIAGTVASSEASAEKLKSFSIPVFDLNAVPEVAFYVDGADEANAALQLIKGGGAALTREKIIAAVAREFLCIADASKRVEVLGRFPLPVEVVPMARSYVAREIVKLGGDPVWREGCVTDNGNVILDVHNLRITDPLELETRLNQIVGVLSNGLFAHRPADLLFLAHEGGVDCLRAATR